MLLIAFFKMFNIVLVGMGKRHKEYDPFSKVSKHSNLCYVYNRSQTPSVSDGPVSLCWLLNVEYLISWEVPQAPISTPNWCT